MRSRRRAAALDGAGARVPLQTDGRHSVQDRTGPRRRRAEPALGLPRPAAGRVALCAAGAVGPADRHLAADVAVLVVGRARGGRLCPAGRSVSPRCCPPLICSCCSSSARSPCAAPAAPSTTSSTRRSTPQVERTRSRPLPSGQVSRRQAWIFLVAQALVGLAVLLQFNDFAILVGLCSLGRGGDLSIHEANHQLASARPRPRLFLGCADGLGGGVRRSRRPRDHALSSAASAG